MTTTNHATDVHNHGNKKRKIHNNKQSTLTYLFNYNRNNTQPQPQPNYSNTTSTGNDSKSIYTKKTTTMNNIELLRTINRINQNKSVVNNEHQSQQQDQHQDQHQNQQHDQQQDQTDNNSESIMTKLSDWINYQAKNQQRFTEQTCGILFDRIKLPCVLLQQHKTNITTNDSAADAAILCDCRCEYSSVKIQNQIYVKKTESYDSNDNTHSYTHSYNSNTAADEEDDSSAIDPAASVDTTSLSNHNNQDMNTEEDDYDEYDHMTNRSYTSSPSESFDELSRSTDHSSRSSRISGIKLIIPPHMKEDPSSETIFSIKIDNAKTCSVYEALLSTALKQQQHRYAVFRIHIFDMITNDNLFITWCYCSDDNNHNNNDTNEVVHMLKQYSITLSASSASSAINECSLLSYLEAVSYSFDDEKVLKTMDHVFNHNQTSLLTNNNAGLSFSEIVQKYSTWHFEALAVAASASSVDYSDNTIVILRSAKLFHVFEENILGNKVVQLTDIAYRAYIKHYHDTNPNIPYHHDLMTFVEQHLNFVIRGDLHTRIQTNNFLSSVSFDLHANNDKEESRIMCIPLDYTFYYMLNYSDLFWHECFCCRRRSGGSAESGDEHTIIEKMIYHLLVHENDTEDIMLNIINKIIIHEEEVEQSQRKALRNVVEAFFVSQLMRRNHNTHNTHDKKTITVLSRFDHGNTERYHMSAIIPNKYNIIIKQEDAEAHRRSAIRAYEILSSSVVSLKHHECQKRCEDLYESLTTRKPHIISKSNTSIDNNSTIASASAAAAANSLRNKMFRNAFLRNNMLSQYLSYFKACSAAATAAAAKQKQTDQININAYDIIIYLLQEYSSTKNKSATDVIMIDIMLECIESLASKNEYHYRYSTAKRHISNLENTITADNRSLLLPESLKYVYILHDRHKCDDDNDICRHYQHLCDNDTGASHKMHLKYEHGFGMDGGIAHAVMLDASVVVILEGSYLTFDIQHKRCTASLAHLVDIGVVKPTIVAASSNRKQIIARFDFIRNYAIRSSSSNNMKYSDYDDSLLLLFLSIVTNGHADKNDVQYIQKL